jgi:hypothetical protein
MAEEKFYTVQELASEWKLSDKVIRKLMRNHPDVMKLYGPGLLMGTAKRMHVTLRIPESVKNQIRASLTKPVPKPVLTMKKPPRTIRRVQRFKAA